MVSECKEREVVSRWIRKRTQELFKTSANFQLKAAKRETCTSYKRRSVSLSRVSSNNYNYCVANFNFFYGPMFSKCTYH